MSICFYWLVDNIDLGDVYISWYFFIFIFLRIFFIWLDVINFVWIFNDFRKEIWFFIKVINGEIIIIMFLFGKWLCCFESLFVMSGVIWYIKDFLYFVGKFMNILFLLRNFESVFFCCGYSFWILNVEYMLEMVFWKFCCVSFLLFFVIFNCVKFGNKII